ncbi:MAG: nuclear transport factor 2 family protein [Myxococcota bacterium]
MSFLTRTSYDPDVDPNPYALAHALREAWEAEAWERMGALCRDDVVLEGPTPGRVVGRVAVVALFREGRRFPGMTGSDHRRTVAGEDVAIQVYDVYIAHERRVTVTDILSVRDGRVAQWQTFDRPGRPSRARREPRRHRRTSPHMGGTHTLESGSMPQPRPTGHTSPQMSPGPSTTMQKLSPG